MDEIYEKKNELDLLDELIGDLDNALEAASESITPSVTSDPLFYLRNVRKKYMEKKMELSDELIDLMLNKLEE